MASRRVFSRLSGVALASLLLAALAPEAAAAHLLTDGDLVPNLSGAAFALQACPGAIELVTTPENQTDVHQQTVAPVAPGSYTLSGSVRVDSGSPSITAALVWRDGNGSTISQTNQSLAPGSSYQPFILTGSPPAGTASVVGRLTVTSSGDATVCVDSFNLQGPPPGAATAAPTATATPLPTATATATLTATPEGPPPAATQPPQATQPPLADSSPSAPGPSGGTGGGLRFENGGFERGLAGWDKFGGELMVANGPVNSGSAAGAFVSATESTKWAFQLVAIDPAQAYELSGYLWANAGVEAAYLRISWYESANGDGRAMTTDDSLARISGDSGGYVFLTTGPIQPPAGAHSARLRAMLAPRGAGRATLYLDDFSFFELPPGSAPPRPAGQTSPPGGETAADEPQAAPGNARTSTAPPSQPSAASTFVAEVSDESDAAGAEDADAAQGGAGGGLSLLWPGAGLLFLVGLGGGYVYARRRPP